MLIPDCYALATLGTLTTCVSATQATVVLLTTTMLTILTGRVRLRELSDSSTFLGKPNNSRKDCTSNPEMEKGCVTVVSFEIVHLQARITIMKEDYFDKAISFRNLRQALNTCCNNVRWKDSVVGYELHALQHTTSLVDDLENGKYKLQKYQNFTIYEPKQREITATRIRDRQVQRAMCDVGLYQDFVEHFIHDNCACQVGKGSDFVFKRMKAHMRKHFQKYGNSGWVLKCDIEKFFPSTPHETAKAAVAKLISDERAKQMVFTVIDSFDGDKGIGLGSQFSQLIELAVLNNLDHFIKERLRIKFYVRYMDDFILVHPDEEYLQFCKQEIQKQVEAIGLTLNRKTTIYPLSQGIRFLQWRFFYTDTGKIKIHLNRKKLSKQRKKLSALLEKESTGDVEEGTAERSLIAFLANAKRSKRDTYFQRKAMLDYFAKEVAKYDNRRANDETGS